MNATLFCACSVRGFGFGYFFSIFVKESIYKMTEDSLKAVDFLRRGKVILYPTDTVWGIGCDATNDDAARSIYALKRRDDSKSMIVLVDSIEMLSRYVGDIPETVIDLMENSERPTTVILPDVNGLAPSIVASDGTVGFRLSRERFSAGICRLLGCPVVSTSANVSGMPAARNFNEISDEIIGGVDYVCVTGRDEKQECRPSRIVRLESDNTITVIRD